MNMNGQPKAPFYVVLFLVVGGLLAFAAYRSELAQGTESSRRPVTAGTILIRA
jgi:hypothetical protein